MAQTLSNFDAALRIDYLPAVREQLNNDTLLMSKVKRNSEDVSGKQWMLVAHYGRSTGVGARPDSGTLPTAGNQSYANPYGTVKYNYARIQVTDPTMKASRNDTGAITRALTSEMERITNDLKKYINYQLFNDGSGVVAVVNGDPGTGTTLTLDGPGTQYLYDGAIVDVTDASTGVVEDSAVVLSTITSTTAATASAALDANIENNSKVRFYGAHDGAGTSYEMMGLKGIVDDGTYAASLHNITRSSNPWFNASTHANDDNSGTNRSLTLDLMQASFTAVEKNGGKVGLIVTTHELRDAYAALLVADKRYVNTMELDGGFSGLEYNGVALVADIDCPPNTMFFLDLDHLFLMQMGDFDWMSEDGAVLNRVANGAAYGATLTWYADLATDRPRSHSFLRDVQ